MNNADANGEQQVETEYFEVLFSQIAIPIVKKCHVKYPHINKAIFQNFFSDGSILETILLELVAGKHYAKVNKSLFHKMQD